MVDRFGNFGPFQYDDFGGHCEMNCCLGLERFSPVLGFKQDLMILNNAPVI